MPLSALLAAVPNRPIASTVRCFPPDSPPPDTINGAIDRRYGDTESETERLNIATPKRQGKRNGMKRGTSRRRRNRPARASRLTGKRDGESRSRWTHLTYICGLFAHLFVLGVFGLSKLYI